MRVLLLLVAETGLVVTNTRAAATPEGEPEVEEMDELLTVLDEAEDAAFAL